MRRAVQWLICVASIALAVGLQHRPAARPDVAKPAPSAKPSVEDEAHVNDWREPGEPNHETPGDFEWESLAFEDCGSTTDLRVVQISSCTYQFDEPCPVPIGQPVEVTVEFDKRGEDTAHMQHEAFWVLNGVNTLASVSPEHCAGAECPFEAPDGLAFKAAVTVSKRYPALQGTLFWKVWNDVESEPLICFKTPIRLYHPSAEEQEDAAGGAAKPVVKPIRRG